MTCPAFSDDCSKTNADRPTEPAEPSRAIGPGAVLGLLGGGQLGRMFAIAAAQLGYRVHLLAPDVDPPAGQVAWKHTRADYDDLDAVARFAQQVDAVTYEWENLPLAAAQEAARFVPVSPQPHVLGLTQNRIREKTFLREHGLPCAAFNVVRNQTDLAQAIEQLGCPVVLKSAQGGYDGKGQVKVHQPADAASAWSQINVDAVAEGWVDFQAELSVLIVRNVHGQMATYGPLRNVHTDHILDHTAYPAGLSEATCEQARELALAVGDALNLVGVCCIEMFLTRQGQVLINELAPRPHNSGHLTIEACVTSQFEQQVRTMCNLPVGSSRFISPAAAMANLLGDPWPSDPANWQAVLDQPDVSLHLYGKTDARRGRKMGHLTSLANDPQQAVRQVLAARDALRQAVANELR